MLKSANYALTAVPVAATAIGLSAMNAFAQSTDGVTPTTPVTPSEPVVPYLMYFTFGAVLLVAVAALISFLRKRSNREAADRVLNPNHPSNQ